MRGQGRLAWAAVVACGAVALSPDEPAGARTPEGFFGVVANGALLDQDFDRMSGGGAGKLRFLLSWREVQPSPGTFDWTSVDATVGRAADRGIEVLPFVFGSPEWIGAEARPPIRSARERRAWMAFLTGAVERYGRGGSFWSGRAEYGPVKQWQIWNEPNYERYWRPRPSARGYAKLLALSAKAIGSADRRARIVLAGVASVRDGPLPWVFLRDLYRVKRVERHFDLVAVHPYSPSLIGVRYQLAQMRRTIAKAGDRRTPIAVTEIGWGSDGPADSPLVKGPKGQARLLKRAFRLLAHQRRRYRLDSVQWLSFQDSAVSEPGCGFCQYTGLFTLEREPKPAWREFRRFTRR
jgi:hypothetical protein